jgi:hypothetical protein
VSAHTLSQSAFKFRKPRVRIASTVLLYLQPRSGAKKNLQLNTFQFKRKGGDDARAEALKVKSVIQSICVREGVDTSDLQTPNPAAFNHHFYAKVQPL